MSTNSKRSLPLNDVKLLSGKSGPVVYIMSRDQRAQDNHALIEAQQAAIKLGVGLWVLFGLKPRSGYRTAIHYDFMLEGLEEVKVSLGRHGIGFSIIDTTKGAAESIKRLLEGIEPSAVYFDFSPLRYPSKLRSRLSRELSVPCYVVDTHNVVPVWQASGKQEVGARTLRPKINSQLSQYLKPPKPLQDHPYRLSQQRGVGVSFDEARSLINELERPDSYSQIFTPGETAAHTQLDDFIDNRLDAYDEIRNEPSADGLSGLSPYLHFGQISSLRVALEVERRSQSRPEAFLEELIVRKELSDNFCYYNPDYDSLRGASQWAKDTLARHEVDPRPYIYSRDQLEQAQTHDPAWNAAQIQMVKTGKMHGYMRMYWAKKILEWSENAEVALEHGIYLNDRYSLDGNDPNGYVGLLWSIAGLHDRGWTERDIFGKVRYMNYNGLKRKFDIELYQKQWLD